MRQPAPLPAPPATAHPHPRPAGRLRLAAAGGLLLALVLGTLPALAQTSHPEVVSPRPVPWTPHIQDGTVHAITVVGDAVVVGGTFTEVTDASQQATHRRPYLLAFSRHTGQLGQFAPELDGPVYALAPGPGGTVYAGGGFRHVGGVPQRGVTQLRIDTGERIPQFQASINWGSVLTMTRHGEQLYLGGTFTAVSGEEHPGLARLLATTGAVDPTFDAQLSNRADGRLSVRALTLAPTGERLVAVGNFTHSHGRLRRQLVMFDTGGQQAGLADWYTDSYEPACAPIFHTYLRGVDFAPDGTYFVVVTTGGRTHPDELCNTAARFEATGTGMHRPSWVNHTGGNSLYAVEATGPAVYVGGHQLWQDNPHGNKFPGPGAVQREGIAALHPAHGQALPWNPGRARGVGVQAFLAAGEGLYVGSDTTRLGGEHRGRIGMFPLTG